MGYDDYVKEELDGKCEVVYDAEDNGRFAAYTLWQANQMFKHHGHFDVVHWNNGYWDMNIEAPMTEAMHPVEEYVHFLKRIIKLCRENGREDRLRDHHADLGARHGGRQHRHASGQHQLQ